MKLWRRLAIGLGVLVAVALLLVRPITRLTVPPPKGTRVVLWHSQRGKERELLEKLIRQFNDEHAGAVYVEPLAVPDGVFKDKVRRSIPHGSGPDVFIRPHNEIGELSDARVLGRLDPGELPAEAEEYVGSVLDGVRIDSRLVAIPLTYKGLVQFYNTRLLPDGPIKSSSELVSVRKRLPAEAFPLAYDATSLFFEAPFFLARGGRVLDDAGTHFTVFDGPGRAAFDEPGAWRRAGILPPEVSYNEASRLFEGGQAAVFITGPWYLPGGSLEAKDDWDVAPLFDVDGKPAGSFISVESAFLSAASKHRVEALQLIQFLGGRSAQQLRYSELGLPPVWQSLYAEPASVSHSRGALLTLHLVNAERHSLEHGLVTPSSTRMGAVWNPALDVLSASVAGRDVEQAIASATYTLDKVEKSEVQPQSSTLYGAILVGLLLVGCLLVVRQVRVDSGSFEAKRMRLLGFWGRGALPYLLPGVVAVLLLVVAPMLVSAGMSLFSYQHGTFTFVGMTNFREILLPPSEHAFEARSFYFALLVTVVWTLVNVTLHLALGVALALLLRNTFLRFRTGYRLILVLPWAIPNYITALVWKGMFHAQIGAINQLLSPFGFKGYNWFDRFGTAFFANVLTNTWLGFPFMMIVTLGALAQIPTDLEEAAILDGASRWTRFTRIILPHVRPALLPSILLGSVWTFNMFNVVYLVSGGEPGSQTDILVSEAYRWAFERGERYGYAAAYSVLIFCFLLFYGRLTRRLEGSSS